MKALISVSVTLINFACLLLLRNPDIATRDDPKSQRVLRGGHEEQTNQATMKVDQNIRDSDRFTVSRLAEKEIKHKHRRMGTTEELLEFFF